MDNILLKLKVINEKDKLNKCLHLLEEGVSRLHNEGRINIDKSEYLKGFINRLIEQEKDFLVSEPEEYFDLYMEDDDIYDELDLM